MNIISKHRNLVCSLILFSSLFFGTKAHATWGNAVANGNWSDAHTWDMARSPDDNDSLIIPAGITVTVNINSKVYANMAVLVYGTLDFEVGQKIKFCDGCLYVLAGGQLTGGNGGSKIELCGAVDWTGPGPTPGPWA